MEVAIIKRETTGTGNEKFIVRNKVSVEVSKTSGSSVCIYPSIHRILMI
jgi:hypothetical protein